MPAPAEDDIVATAETLRPLIAKGTCMALVGAGPSLPAGYHEWWELIQQLSQTCDVPAKLSPDSTTDELLDAAESAHSHNGAAFWEYLRVHFGRPVTVTNQLYQTLSAVEFRAFLTTNFDPLLARALRDNQPARPFYAHPHLDASKLNRGAICYLHGWIPEDATANTPNPLILTRSQFDAAYAPDSDLRTALVQALGNYSICFIGSSARDRYMEEVLKRCMRNRAGRISSDPTSPPPSRYVLLRRERADPVNREHAIAKEHEKVSHYDGLGLTVLWYPDDPSPNHVGLLRVFETLAGRVPLRPSNPWAETGAIP